MVKFHEISNSLHGRSDRKALAIRSLCEKFEPVSNFINLNQEGAVFAKFGYEQSPLTVITDAFLSRLAHVEFGFNGFMFAGGTHISTTEATQKEAEEFGLLYGSKYGNKIPLIFGAAGSFMEIISRGFNKSKAVTFGGITKFNDVVAINKETKYCVINSNVFAMEDCIIRPSKAAIFFDGGIGTAMEVFKFLELRREGDVGINAPIIFVVHDNEPLHSTIEIMKQRGKIDNGHSNEIYKVKTAQEAMDILSNSLYFNNLLDCCQKEDEITSDLIRSIFLVPKNMRAM